MRFPGPCLVLVAAAACASTSPAPAQRTTPGSRGLRANAHLDAARAHEQRAAELARWPEMQRDAAGFQDPASGLWYRAWDTAEAEKQEADHHRAEAAKLQADYEALCSSVPPENVRLSPLERYGQGGFNTADGVTVMLTTDAGPPARLLTEMQCHRAWMMLAEAGMEDCPLDLAGIKVQTYGDASGISIEIKVSDPALVPELQRRAAKDLEKAEQLRDRSAPH